MKREPFLSVLPRIRLFLGRWVDKDLSRFIANSSPLALVSAGWKEYYRKERGSGRSEQMTAEERIRAWSTVILTTRPFSGRF
jgi:hypothetical protein